MIVNHHSAIFCQLNIIDLYIHLSALKLSHIKIVRPFFTRCLNIQNLYYKGKIMLINEKKKGQIFMHSV